ncbi:2TM domain-containing protein [Galbibacter sp. PAP.153]|uniref:2TM domain-containing protein n=1 Tax=Galbibacter sp. PAP.153 TaxID=3104623 RepID=UPI003009EF64
MNIIKEIARGFSLGVLIFLIIGIINYLNGTPVEFDHTFITSFLYNQLYTIVLYTANTILIKLLFKRYGKELYTLKNIWIFLVGSGVVTFICLFFINLFIKTVIGGTSVATFISSEEISDYIQPLVISFIIAVLFSAFFYYRKRQESKVKEQKVIAGRATAQFDALKNQLDPHFLFNSLNVLTSLIDENPDAAQKFTTALSKVYRYVLEQKNKELVTVAEEISFSNTYMSLLKMRFEDSIIFNVSEGLLENEAKVVPLSLQLLLENAVKHNQVNPKKPLQINIYQDHGYLVISNRLQPKEVVKKSSGVGLFNIKQRYNLLTTRKVLIEQDTEQFSVKIPMLTKQISTMTIQEDYIRDKRYKRAKERVDAIKGFYGNLTAYIIVIPCLAWLNYQTTSFPWIIFPTLGWGFGILMHAMEAYGYNPLWGKRWEERKIKELMEKDI